MPKLYHISLTLVKTLANPQNLDPIMTHAGYWARLSMYSWYVWSNKTPQQVYAAISPHFTVEDSIVVSTVDASVGAFGWAPQWFWDFVNTGWQKAPPAG